MACNARGIQIVIPDSPSIMRVLLINPYYPISETPSPPLGLACLAAALENAGVDVRLLDFVVTPYSSTVLNGVLDAFAPDLVGVTSVTMTFNDAISIVKHVRNLRPETRTVMGGPHVTFCAAATLKQFPELDFVIRGEGEQTIVDLAEAVSTGYGWQTVSGLAYRDGTDIVSNPRNARPPNLDDLPVPARHHLMLGRYRALGLPVSMTTSRGCPHHCIFCVGNRMNGRGVRYRHPIAVVDEMEMLSRLGFHQINIADDLFTANPNHCSAVCREILQRGLAPAWTAFARVDSVSRDLLKTMKSAGCHTVSFGVESANPEILKTVRKGITKDQVLRAVRECVESEITPQVSFILGLPGETPGTMRQSIAFGKKLRSIGALHGFHLLAPFPGSEVRDRARDYGIRIIHSNWQQYHANRAVAETATVSCRMLNRFIVEWEAKYDEYLGDIRQRMITGEASAEEAWQLVRLEHTVILYELMMNRALEKYGTWRNGNGPIQTEGALNELTQRIGTGNNFTTARLLDTLTFAYDGGNLDYRFEDGVIRWKWVEYL